MFAQICREWDEAEKDIKNAEQVCGEVVFPAIMELRYAGRRLIQALQFSTIENNNEEVRKLLHDAWFDCHRSRHDAIDAATAQISKILDIATDKLGHDVVLAAYPEFTKLLKKLDTLRTKITKSRGSAEERDGIYQTIENSDFPDLIESFNDFRSCEPIMKKMAGKRRLFNVSTIVLAIIAILMTGIDIVLHEIR